MRDEAKSHQILMILSVICPEIFLLHHCVDKAMDERANEHTYIGMDVKTVGYN